MTLPSRSLALALAVFLHGAPAHALDPRTPLASYRLDTFGVRAGAPRHAMSIAQQADGWMWFGTPSGLYRYDGMKFELFRPRPGERLLGQYIGALRAHPNGELWISYLYGGVSVLRDGHLRHLAGVPGKPIGSVSAFAPDGADTWVASTTGLWRYRAGGWERFGADRGFPDGWCGDVHRDPYGRVWAADDRHVYLLDRGAGRFAPVVELAAGATIVDAPDGRVWVADGVTVRLLPAPPGGWRAPPPSPVRNSTMVTLFDRDGNYWTGGCPKALCMRRPARIAGRDVFPDLDSGRPDVRDGKIGSASINAMMEDREGNLWTSTAAGLERLRDTRLVPLVLPDSNWPGLALDRTGAVWIATSDAGLHGRLWRAQGDDVAAQRSDQRSGIVAMGRDGTVLVAGRNTIERRLGDRIVARHAMPPRGRRAVARDAVLLLAEDREGIWLYLGNGRGLFRLRGGAWEPPSAHPWLAGVIYAFVDGAGRTWFGTRNNGVVLVDGDRHTEYGPGDGIALGAVTFVDAQADPVISGEGGMAVLQHGRFRPLRAEGVDLANVSGLVATPDGNRWLGTARGLFRVPAAAWRRSMADRGQPLRGELWDELHGFPGSGYGSSPSPTLRLAPDGRLWVAGLDGVAVYDRTRLRRNTTAPQARVQALVANEQRYEGGAAGTLRAGTTRLRFDFAAPSMTMPERVRFRYRLDGVDAAWQEAGGQRSAYYTNLGPGTYRFEVQATNEDGVAGPAATTPPFRIAPTFVQTRWFLVLCVLLAGAAAWLLYALRLAQLKRTWQARTEERIAERERIARTLHDTFLQGLHALILRLDAFAARLLPGSGERTQIEDLLDVARKVTEEGRSQVLGLRSGTGAPDLASALAASVALLRTGDDVDVAWRETGQPRTLDPDTQAEVHRIACEAVANALRHARARRIEVTLDWSGPGLVVRVADDGVGMAEELIASGLPGHWGLAGMRERAAAIGATLALHNRPGGGVEVVLALGGDAAPAPRRMLAAQAPN
ncbi:triple tyrosine motif-containing protein [Massilia sp. YIM B02763]|uniref:sensor histidine kinase n=1 Tax=Massilia sp. YIM B02763 TaxID=3050130 RepID=UPI0025B6878C|nr:sensor histidine kinase [Massilia sp. YIM B02763]MDN4055132.1 triple tyrosine motif-containing protein [Massilia sp. YIM B02763]